MKLGKIYFYCFGIVFTLFGKQGYAKTLPDQNKNLQGEVLHNDGADSIEDAILAALEQAQKEEDAKNMITPKITSGTTDSSGQFPPTAVTDFPPKQQQQQFIPPSFSQIASNSLNPQHLLTSPFSPHHPLNSLAIAAAAEADRAGLPTLPPLLPALTATGRPTEYIHGIFGSLAGVVDNSIKVLTSSGNLLFGVGVSVGCQLSHGCNNNNNNKSE